jgi:hypothetical protein
MTWGNQLHPLVDISLNLVKMKTGPAYVFNVLFIHDRKSSELFNRNNEIVNERHRVDLSP